MVAIGSGANINFDKLRVVSDMAEIGTRREFMLAACIPEKEGTILFVSVIDISSSVLIIPQTLLQM